MARNISFSLTTDQIRSRIKSVTRRKGWKFLKSGDVLNACVKCMGLKPGEKIEVICQIRVLSATRESLMAMAMFPAYGDSEATREGFLAMSRKQFIEMFCQHMGGTVDQTVTRIEFEYL